MHDGVFKRSNIYKAKLFATFFHEILIIYHREKKKNGYR